MEFQRNAFPHTIRLILSIFGLTIREVAKLTGVDPCTIHAWLRGDNEARPEYLKALADALSEHSGRTITTSMFWNENLTPAEVLSSPPWIGRRPTNRSR
ncbi:MAG: helix-turn-helix transcriptional regulator [Acidobacteriaceae bacterium]|nr:helix-turn-helix transcriptional regulator [Acidobacteriaceae bacterium]